MSKMLATVILSCLTCIGHAQDIRSVLDQASRTIDWGKNAGVPDGIPHRTNNCKTLNAGVSAAQINAEIIACSNLGGGVVFLSAGTYNLSSAIDFTGAQNVTLRGAGAMATKLIFTGSGIGCGQGSAAIAIANCNARYFAYNGVGHTNWTGGYGRGETKITVANADNISEEQIIVLDQMQDVTDNGGAVVTSCKAGSARLCGTWQTSNDDPDTGDWAAWGRGPCTTTCNSSELGDRIQMQVVKVKAKSGNTLTISPGLYMTNWRAEASPQVWYYGNLSTLSYMNGLEALTVDTRGGSMNASVTLYAAYGSWVKGIRTIGASTQSEHLYAVQTSRCEFRDNYLYGTSTGSVVNYAIVPLQSSDLLVINNITQRMAGAFATSTHSGTVFAYNYSVDSTSSSASWMQHSYQNHGPDNYVLAEGNDFNGHLADNLHGSAPYLTDVRNYYSGWEPGKSSDTTAAQPTAYRRGTNWIGNVIGTLGYQDHYEDCASPPPCNTPIGTGDPNKAIFIVGYANTGTTAGVVAYDPLAYTTMVRWGNYDTVHRAARYLSSEVSPGGAKAFMPAVAVPSTQTIPNTFFLSETDRVTWWNTPWGTPPWPPIGPDVTAGNIPESDGRANKIPARLCFEKSAVDPLYSLTPAIKSFEASACYRSLPASAAPAAPANLQVSP